MRLAIFPFHVSKVFCLRARVMTGHTKCCTCRAKSSYHTHQRPDLLASLMKMYSALHLPRKMHLRISSSNAPRLPSPFEMPQNPHVLLTFRKVQIPLHLLRKTTPERPKVARTPQFFTLLTWKRASRHNGVHFFNL